MTARSASGMEVARVRTGLLCGTWEPVTPMLREKYKWKKTKYESTDAEYRGGTARMSEEALVTGVEQRG